MNQEEIDYQQLVKLKIEIQELEEHSKKAKQKKQEWSTKHRSLTQQISIKKEQLIDSI